MIGTLDLVILIVAMLAVAGISLAASWRERTRDDYFLAGRSLSWWLVGFSLIASNISTEHFVGMTGTAASSGLAVASYEWLSAIALVFVAWWLLPHFLRTGIYTMPEFLEYRFDRGARSILAALMVVAFVVALLAMVLYSGSVFLSNVLGIPDVLESRLGVPADRSDAVAFQIGVWSIGLGAGLYTVIGGLRAVVWSDLIQGAGLVLGGLVVTFLALRELGDGQGLVAGWRSFAAENKDNLHLIMPRDDSVLPWPTLISGLWIPVMFYWGLNQFITQRSLAAGSLREGQKGVLFAAGIKLLLPLIIVLPGMMAVQILGERIPEDTTDAAYPLLVKELLPVGVFGLMLAAITGAVMSTFNSGLNSAATVFTLDLFQPYIRPDLSEAGSVRVGRITTGAFVVAACLWAPVITRFEGVFAYIQEVWGFVSAPTAAVFFVGLLFRRVPSGAAKAALIVGPLLYLVSRLPAWVLGTDEAAADVGGAIERLYAYSSMHFLYHMFVIFILLVGGMLAWRAIRPLERAVTLPDRAQVDVTPWKGVYPAGGLVIAVTIVLYILFW